jgi:DNA-binding transcriptional regulator YhcF (GntR family)
MPKPEAGFIFLHRKIREHWLWKDANKFKWWCDILMECNHTDQKVPIGFDLIDCNRGQSVNSLRTWARAWRVDVSLVRRFFKMLESDGMILIEDMKKTTRITVCNYDSYNGSQHTIQTQSKRNPTQTIMYNNVNNENTYTEEEQTLFGNFQKWVLKKAPAVAKMKEPFTIADYLQAKQLYSMDKIKDYLQRMHNWQPIIKSNKNAYLTLKNWISRDEKKAHHTEDKAISIMDNPRFKQL